MNREPIERVTNYILTISQLLKHTGATMTMLTFALLLLMTTTQAQSPTPLEQQCMTAVQGKVAWNQAGDNSWGEANIRSLCKGTTNPSATISCFQAQIKQHKENKTL